MFLRMLAYVFSRAALLFAHGDLRWDKFHILISRSTTPDLMKIVSKLDEFIMQQFTSSKRAFGAMGPLTGSVRQKLHEKHKSSDEDSCEYTSLVYTCTNISLRLDSGFLFIDSY